MISYSKIGYIIFIATLLFIGKEDLSMAKAKEIQLPQPITKGIISLEEAIAKRRSQRSFSKKELTLYQISQLLWAAQGITERRGGHSLRNAPSAGALYPMEIYALTKDGVYHYLPERHALEVLSEGDLRGDLCNASLGQSSVSDAPLDIVICAVYDKVTFKYGERGKRYADIETGHIAQNIHLQAVALGLVSVPIGAFSDEEVKSILNLPADHVPLYIIPVGHSHP
ncbi:MAG: SagB/ThcOx family dehydrogenase [Candidatus Omnitrophica bacterium]|nr:SagB/ThcOx family dehydrogenase [Candidatus Omnitrophota bacterium]MBU4488996.1 SagB/ThcOx family dehydrogenase [Candidatus Omnitrophota bacterium]